MNMKTGLKLLVAAASVCMALAAIPARAALITQFWDFSFDYDETSIGSGTPSYSTVAGTLSFTYDSATPSSLFHQAVDSIAFTIPGGLFHTSDIYFDLRLGPDLNFPPLGSEPRYEFSIYYDTEPVFLNNASDWLMRAAGIGFPGDEFVFGSYPIALDFFTSSGNVSEYAFFSFAPTQVVSTTSLAGGGGDVPVPGSLALLGLGLAGAGAFARRGRVAATA
ncbi:MAG: PEP-CTERM sorting domain-containing protein [Rhodobacteraceae bacterium]|nr:PEP-CTERM sorting domain-containing protein [Paracoccaceae bacterium]